MQSAKEKLSNMGSAAKEHFDIYKAKAQEKAVKASAKTDEEKEIASEMRKAKEAKAKMEFHEAIAEHAAAAQKLAATANKPHLIHEPAPADADVPANHDHDHDHDRPLRPKATVPAYPLGGYRTHKYPL